MALARPKTKAQQAIHSGPTEHVGSPATQLTLGEALERWYTSLAASERIKSQRTIDAYRYGTNKLVQSVGAGRPLANITAEDLEALLAELKRSGITPGGRAVVFRPIKTFMRWCVKRGYMSASPAEEVDAPKPAVRPVEFVTDDEWAAILRTTEHHSRWAFRARRDRAVLLMLATTGARLSEVAELRLSDVDMAARTVTVMGKGSKVRVLPLLDEAHGALQAYLTLERPRSPFSGTTDALWLAPRGPLTANGIAQLVAERGKTAGIKRRVHPHELRHRAIATWLRKGMPDTLVMALSGHSTHAMLNRYGAASRQEDAMAFLRALPA